MSIFVVFAAFRARVMLQYFPFTRRQYNAAHTTHPDQKAQHAIHAYMPIEDTTLYVYDNREPFYANTSAHAHKHCMRARFT